MPTKQDFDNWLLLQNTLELNQMTTEDIFVSFIRDYLSDSDNFNEVSLIVNNFEKSISF